MIIFFSWFLCDFLHVLNFLFTVLCRFLNFFLNFFVSLVAFLYFNTLTVYRLFWVIYVLCLWEVCVFKLFSFHTLLRFVMHLIFFYFSNSRLELEFPVKFFLGAPRLITFIQGEITTSVIRPDSQKLPIMMNFIAAKLALWK